MLKKVKIFLKEHWDKKSLLLLGYSGGPDSKALLYALLESGCKNLHLAHVDHGWRKESKDEAEMLKKEAEGLSLPFHMVRLETVPTKNQEDMARQERLKFFRKLAKTIPFQAVFLAHHAGDLSETVLKRVMEGAHLPFLGGMEKVALQEEGPPIWRPLLETTKEEIYPFLEKRNLSFITDATNLSSSYLRGKMRVEMLPTLEKTFGKKSSENFLHLSKRAFELKEYLDKKTDQIKRIPVDKGFYIDSTDLEKIEVRYWLQKECKKQKITLARGRIEQILTALFLRKRKVFFEPSFITQGGKLFVLSCLK